MARGFKSPRRKIENLMRKMEARVSTGPIGYLVESSVEQRDSERERVASIFRNWNL
ncbi:hypothetical protein GcC1_100036 [Golovinomyces cichoracearum]|uniref:Uncharacterized protein n=1 Tax=Golovinomyces cichoracearum TaxID=62708 RepID=A0A420IA29_9PEZI|nr:hypothetical protein GcC1_100036 [Golovinomyces cichoracearum]